MGNGAQKLNSDDIIINRVPDNSVEFLRSWIIHYIEEMKDIYAEIRQSPKQPTKLVIYGGKSVTEHKDGAKTNKIFVKNIPEAADEEILEAFFEHRKKGRDSVVNVQLNRLKNSAIIEFCETDAVERIISEAPIKIMNTELDICLCVPLFQSEGLVWSLPEQLTRLLAVHEEGIIEDAQISSEECKSGDEDSEYSTKIL